MVAEKTTELTEDEAELYDRQIRLWGLESQKRLRRSRVLVIGLKGFGAELVKNIVLSGVKSVTLLDDCVVSEEDTCSQFLAPRECIGKPRAESSVSRAQALNPMVQVTADTSRVEDKPDEYFANFDVVVATECRLSELQRINTACRERCVKFFCGDVFGMFGYTFADLQTHNFVEDVIKTVKINDDKLGRDKKVEPIKETVKQTENFVSLSDALSVDWTFPDLKKKLEKMDYSYFLMRVLLEFREKYHRDPDPKYRNSDIQALKNLRQEVLNNLQVPENKIPDSILGQLFAEVSPVCAIVGGVLSQEVVKTLSQKEAPHNNFFFFNPEKCCGFVETHGS
ncbi:UNVERIFIED_CONTAM: hypothetical protein PYX00_010241 [Menopon gallinae]|uniref:SUMO-activating enzyme subunit 1 n=1 Tax=Menopon gallinae TaxID=328185 RepID=A0AAW2HEC1_9NEOP